MDDAKNLATLSGQLADPARAAIVLNLMDGSSQPTGELQVAANVSPSSASAHLSKLVNAKVLSVVKHGRLKYYRISSAAVAHAIEALTVVASPAAVRRVARSSINPFSFARTCYDHLAGKLGVEIVSALQGKKIIRAAGKAFDVTDAGYEWLQDFGLDCDALREERRLLATQCLDFTERRYHLGGALGAAFLSRMIQLEWLAKSRVPRSVRLTTKGMAELGKRLNLEFSAGQNVTAKFTIRHNAR
ncbi:MAG TPA: helix-turn-helix transcriptional regulator [Terriglobales bacterium]|nr:helix-turn-helix transcriptional regulator [Terriglobales bacterium]